MSPDTVHIMDSMSLFMQTNITTILQIAKIYQPSKYLLNVHKLSVQQQEGTMDCGIFAVAFAVEVCVGNNVENVSFNQKKMRKHLYDCLSKGVMTPFPKMSSKLEHLPRPTCVERKLKVYCLCKMPEVADSKMISCDICNHWFHYSCVNLQFDEDPKYWECPLCLQ